MLPSGGDLHSQPRERRLVVVQSEIECNIYCFIHCLKHDNKSIKFNECINCNSIPLAI